VHIDKRRIKRVATILDQNAYAMPTPRYAEPPYPGEGPDLEALITYFLALNSIDYMYRHPETGRTFDDGGLINGSLLAQRLTAHHEALADPRYLGNMTVFRASRLFAAEHELPEIPRKVRHLLVVGSFLNGRAGRTGRRWLRQFPRAIDLARHVGDHVSGFNDGFLRRAQRFVMQLNGRFGTKLPKGLRDLDGLTIGADHLNPMVLRRLGILEFSENLEVRIGREDLIFANSREELEIRAATVVAGEALLQALREKKRYRNLTVIQLDHALWRQARENPGSEVDMPARAFKHPELPHHLTLTTNY
jgi:hypothetical protein